MDMPFSLGELTGFAGLAALGFWLLASLIKDTLGLTKHAVDKTDSARLDHIRDLQDRMDDMKDHRSQHK